jgi:hypothetical protein
MDNKKSENETPVASHDLTKLNNQIETLKKDVAKHESASSMSEGCAA